MNHVSVKVLSRFHLNRPSVYCRLSSKLNGLNGCLSIRDNSPRVHKIVKKFIVCDMRMQDGNSSLWFLPFRNEKCMVRDFCLVCEA